MSAEHERVKEVFLAVCALAGDERARALTEACGGDNALLREVESLLAHHREVDVIEEPPRDPLGLVGRLVDERYRVESFVAEGGFGFIYRGEQVRWRRPVALKIFKLVPGHDEAVLDAFVREGAILAELSRKTTTIVQSFDIGTLEAPNGAKHLFTVLEWLEGKTLAAAVSDEPGPWDLARVALTLAPVARGLAVAHASGVAHRDVKPGNIFLLEDGGAKLLDFGIAKVAAEHEDGFQHTAGKLAAFSMGYAAPEQLSRKHGSTGPWTDVYALALVGSELLAGRRVIDEAGGFQRERPTPRALGARVPDAVEAVFARALALSPEERFSDAGAFYEALATAAARPESRGLLGRIARRVTRSIGGGPGMSRY